MICEYCKTYFDREDGGQIGHVDSERRVPLCGEHYRDDEIRSLVRHQVFGVLTEQSRADWKRNGGKPAEQHRNRMVFNH